MAEEANLGKKEEEEFSTGPLSVLMMSVKNNTQGGRGSSSHKGGLSKAASGAPGSADRPKLLKLDRSPLSQGSTTWKRSERERDQNRDASAKNSSSKSGCNSSGSGRNERKTKMKPKQKLAQLSTSGNVLGRVMEPSNFPSPSPRESKEWSNPLSARPTQQVRNTMTTQEHLDAPLPNLPPMDPMVDILDVPESNDIGAWFTEGLDDSLQDFDFSGGLEIPDDDDLTQLGFM